MHDARQHGVTSEYFGGIKRGRDREWWRSVCMLTAGVVLFSGVRLSGKLQEHLQQKSFLMQGSVDQPVVSVCTQNQLKNKWNKTQSAMVTFFTCIFEPPFLGYLPVVSLSKRVKRSAKERRMQFDSKSSCQQCLNLYEAGNAASCIQNMYNLSGKQKDRTHS